MLHDQVRKAGAAAAMGGSVLALVLNATRPRPDDYESIGALVQVAVDNESWWRLNMYVLAWTMALALLAFYVISRSMESEPSRSWARAAFPFAVGGVVVGLLTIIMSGYALLGAGQDGGAVGEAVAWVASGFFVAMTASLFGLAPALFGVAMLTSTAYPAWLGWVAIAAGVLGTLAGTITHFGGYGVTNEVLFSLSAVLFTVWMAVAGWWLWKTSSAAPASARATEGV